LPKKENNGKKEEYQFKLVEGIHNSRGSKKNYGAYKQ
jgi:hypothetical protein